LNVSQAGVEVCGTYPVFAVHFSIGFVSKENCPRVISGNLKEWCRQLVEFGLENNLIKKEKPRFNILLKDDKTYPYLKLTNEKFPRLLIVRRVLKDGARYFGPYVSATAIRSVKKAVQRIFPLRQSRDNLDKAPPRRPCLNFQMNICLGPCNGNVSKKEYNNIIEEVILFLKGRTPQLIKKINSDMQKASEQKRQNDSHQ